MGQRGCSFAQVLAHIKLRSIGRRTSKHSFIGESHLFGNHRRLHISPCEKNGMSDRSARVKVGQTSADLMDWHSPTRANHSL
ncbi:hypothetical protein GDO78_010124 [Eleutherodactylus coqui]|uniref:Uncharacterized protein n=1 Tax=Eleutherodactylus coqui TaxID=57060 RepID=A0A8J6FBN3_ELECQ|nr:hypothetical protein GDO78_010124 [Eleutherodactylus coqui]